MTGIKRLEIAEADIIAFPEDARRTLSMLKPFGCRFTVDAFGKLGMRTIAEFVEGPEKPLAVAGAA